MLNPSSFLKNEEETNYVKLIQEWELKKMALFLYISIKKHLYILLCKHVVEFT